MKGPRLTVVPLGFRAASAFVAEHHRHNKPPRGAKYCLGVCDEEGKLRGVAMIGRPVARSYDDGLTAEVNRTATDGCPNANSALYAAAWRVAAALGYRRLITYTQGSEPAPVRLPPVRKSWAEHSVSLKAVRDPVGTGGVQRTLWEIT